MKSRKCRYLAVLLLSAMIWIMTCGLTAMAEGNLVPYDGPSSSQSSTVSTPQQSSGQGTTLRVSSLKVTECAEENEYIISVDEELL